MKTHLRSRILRLVFLSINTAIYCRSYSVVITEYTISTTSQRFHA